MARFEIVDGLLLQSFEPDDLPGAFIITRHRVMSADGSVEPNKIMWSGPGEWVESRDGVPEGWVALWLGTRDATRPHVVFVQRDPIPESADYERGYRRGYTARRRPSATCSMTEPEIWGLMDGWRDRAAPR